MRSARWLALGAAFALYLSAAPAAQADCNLRTHQHVVLYSSTEDPDVLLWDSRFRLRAYHAATFDEAQELVRHARLAPGGTHAVVESCVPDFVDSPLFERPADAVGVLIVSGKYSGQRGWVLGPDVRP
ncbi:MAG TPA: hypothetical protein VMF61_14285 [Candidatus Acidoferrales bacterium]|nr:hypothetical protein [Candidatus Acidoferrales bacterium]